MDETCRTKVGIGPAHVVMVVAEVDVWVTVSVSRDEMVVVANAVTSMLLIVVDVVERVSSMMAVAVRDKVVEVVM